MNRFVIKFTTIICLVAVFAFSCGIKRCEIVVEKPDDIKPLDRENYNDVFTVFWNYFRNCPALVNPPPDTIKVFGTIDTGSFKYRSSVLSNFRLMDENTECDYILNYPFPSVGIDCYLISYELRKKLDSSDLKRKCYIKGLRAEGVVSEDETGFGDKCCFVVPCVNLSSIDDIYFEEKNKDINIKTNKNE